MGGYRTNIGCRSAELTRRVVGCTNNCLSVAAHPVGPGSTPPCWRDLSDSNLQTEVCKKRIVRTDRRSRRLSLTAKGWTPPKRAPLYRISIAIDAQASSSQNELEAALEASLRERLVARGRLPFGLVPGLPTLCATAPGRWAPLLLEAVSKILSHENDDTTEMNEAKPVLRFVFVSSYQSAKVLQPGKQALDTPPFTGTA